MIGVGINNRFPIHASAEIGQEQDKIDLTKPRYDLTTFTGRLSHFATVTSPLTLLASKARLQEARDNVDSIEKRFPKDKLNGNYFVEKDQAEQYWKDKQLVESSVHPDTGDVVPLPFRMSAFVPTNLLVVGGMLTPNPTLATVIFWQWVNQSLNVAVNYSNANKSVPMDMKEVGVAYTAATSSAVAIAVGLTRLVPKLKTSPGVKSVLTKLVPFASVATAGCVNVSAMRWKEIKDGVTIFNYNSKGEKENFGESPIAGRRAVGMTAASRVLTNIPTLILPPLFLTYLQRKKIVPSSGLGARVADLSLIGASLLIFLPPAIATFPQTASIEVDKLEDKFKGLKDENGRDLKVVRFNKGL